MAWHPRNQIEKDFVSAFKSLCNNRSYWQVWSDLMSVIACTISNSVDKIHFEAREKEYEDCIKRLGSVDTAAKLMSLIVTALDENPDQDFLGVIYMSLDLGNHWKGQFFTPYNVSKMMGKMILSEKANDEIKEKGYISVCDSCCGAGALLVAAANSLREAGINYQANTLCVAQDIDRIVAQMCYIQMSLLGCPGYVCVGNSITKPIVGHNLFPEEREGQELWYTPMFCSDIWHYRRILYKLHSLSESDNKATKNEKFAFFFNFNDKEVI